MKMLALAGVAMSLGGIAQADFSTNPNPVGAFGQGALATPSDIVVTQSLDQSIVQFNSVSCNAGGLHTNNWYYRVFDVSGLAADFIAQSVDIGIEQAFAATGAQNIRLRIYDSANLNDTLTNTNIVHESMHSVADQSLTIFNMAAGGTISSGSMIVEIFTPDGQTSGNSFFIGSNPNGQTGPSYIRADACGVTAPTDLAAIGFGGMHIVMDVNGKLVPAPGAAALLGLAGVAASRRRR